MKPMQLLLPGIFLLILGVGNLAVGTFKGEQYAKVMRELSTPDIGFTLTRSSPLKRLAEAPERISPSLLRRKKAQARLEFYELVSIGGRILVLLSAPFLLIGIIIRGKEVSHLARALRKERRRNHSQEWQLE